MQYSLQDIIEKEDPNWINEILPSTNVKFLQNQLCIYKNNSNRKAIIKARIQNINHLVI